MSDDVFLKSSSHTGLSGVNGHEFEWHDSDFERVQILIYQRAGISLHNGKHAMVYSRLSRRLRDTGFQSFKAYLSWLESHEGPEWQEFINALTTNLTSFFREHHHFEIFSDHLKRNQDHRFWRIWCCASSTGEEPYSILMTAIDSLGANAKLSLIASDIDSKVLATAAHGVYRSDQLKNITDAQLHRFFLRGKNGNTGMVKIRPEVQRLVEFIIVNLIHEDWSFGEALDIVFCRNVMIYFDETTQRRVLEKIHKVMVPGGLLFVGHAENFNESRDLFILKGKTVYERQ
jgi:chemotaxis protein methyltransferase CheR